MSKKIIKFAKEKDVFTKSDLRYLIRVLEPQIPETEQASKCIRLFEKTLKSFTK